MGRIDLPYGEGQTAIEAEEREDLIPLWVETNGELNRAEQENINKALLFFERKVPSYERILSISFVKELHRKMFDDVWRWAGTFRKTDKNIGVDKNRITTSLYLLLKDVLYWIENATYGVDEIAIRCKHRLVSIHPFPNGNGRHSRILADILVRSLGKAEFSWGIHTDRARKIYLSALRDADRGFCKNLLAFARS